MTKSARARARTHTYIWTEGVLFYQTPNTLLPNFGLLLLIPLESQGLKIKDEATK